MLGEEEEDLLEPSNHSLESEQRAGQNLDVTKSRFPELKEEAERSSRKFRKARNLEESSPQRAAVCSPRKVSSDPAPGIQPRWVNAEGSEPQRGTGGCFLRGILGGSLPPGVPAPEA
jgi:hypothetical protein